MKFLTQIIAFLKRVRYGFKFKVPLWKGDLGGSSASHSIDNRYIPILRHFLIVLLSLYFILGNPAPVFASIHRYPEGSDRVMYRSKLSLRDRRDRSWQVILFKRVAFGQVESLHLRLVGFPGGVEVAHRAPLTLTTATGKTWRAEDVVDLSLPPNVGEYDLAPVLLELEGTPAIELSLPLTTESAEIPAPPFVVREWQQLFDN